MITNDVISVRTGIQCFLYVFLFWGYSFAQNIDVLPNDFNQAVHLIDKYWDGKAENISNQQMRVNITDNVVIFESRLPLKNLSDVSQDVPIDEKDFMVRTTFLRISPTIEKRFYVRKGKSDPFLNPWVRFILKRDDNKISLKQYQPFVFDQMTQMYEADEEIFLYIQTPGIDGTVELKEWIYARKPNSINGSFYQWKVVSEEFNRRIILELQKNGSVDLVRQVVVNGVDKSDYDEQRRIIKVIHQALPDTSFYITGEDKLASIMPIVYWTREGVKKNGKMSINNRSNLMIEINEPASSYPLIIDPTVNFDSY